MKTTVVPTYEISLYIGNRKGYKGNYFGILDLGNVIAEVQKKEKQISNTVRITSCQYKYDGYDEWGWQISILRYPRFDKSPEEIKAFMLTLGETLLERFEQNRISIVTPAETIMLEREGAEVTYDGKSLFKEEQAGSKAS